MRLLTASGPGATQRGMRSTRPCRAHRSRTINANRTLYARGGVYSTASWAKNADREFLPGGVLRHATRAPGSEVDTDADDAPHPVVVVLAPGCKRSQRWLESGSIGLKRCQSRAASMIIWTIVWPAGPV